jgi:hypothetical protein
MRGKPFKSAPLRRECPGQRIVAASLLNLVDMLLSLIANCFEWGDQCNSQWRQRILNGWWNGRLRFTTHKPVPLSCADPDTANR